MDEQTQAAAGRARRLRLVAHGDAHAQGFLKHKRRFNSTNGDPSMHELSLAESLVELVLESVPEAPRRRMIHEVHVRLGRMSGVVVDSLEFCFAALVQHSPMPQAQLVITEIPLRLHCSNCQRDVVSERDDFLCPLCQAASTEVLSGMELQLQSISVADTDPSM